MNSARPARRRRHRMGGVGRKDSPDANCHKAPTELITWHLSVSHEESMIAQGDQSHAPIDRRLEPCRRHVRGIVGASGRRRTWRRLRLPWRLRWLSWRLRWLSWRLRLLRRLGLVGAGRGVWAGVWAGVWCAVLLSALFLPTAGRLLPAAARVSARVLSAAATASLQSGARRRRSVLLCRRIRLSDGSAGRVWCWLLLPRQQRSEGWRQGKLTSRTAKALLDELT